MTRKYDSSRRAASAARTQQAIVEAAVKLHAKGIITLAAVADEAGVSLPTVNKYFPTREDLFAACTMHVANNLTPPAPESLAAISDPAERIAQAVRQVYTLHETAFGHAWTGYKLEDESPVMAQAMANFEGIMDELAEPLLDDWHSEAVDKEAMTGFVRAMLNPLTYRALRLKGGLDFDTAVNMMALALTQMLIH